VWGRSHLAGTLGLRAIEQDFGVYFVRAQDLFEDLRHAQRGHRLDRRMGGSLAPKLFIIENFGASGTTTRGDDPSKTSLFCTTAMTSGRRPRVAARHSGRTSPDHERAPCSRRRPRSFHGSASRIESPGLLPGCLPVCGSRFERRCPTNDPFRNDDPRALDGPADPGAPPARGPRTRRPPGGPGTGCRRGIPDTGIRQSHSADRAMPEFVDAARSVDPADVLRRAVGELQRGIQLAPGPIGVEPPRSASTPRAEPVAPIETLAAHTDAGWLRRFTEHSRDLGGREERETWARAPTCARQTPSTSHCTAHRGGITGAWVASGVTRAPAAA
jgi:hypothetical protein